MPTARYNPGMDEKPKRRWFAFRLRTLFVVVFVASLPLAWVAHSLNWIRERHRVFPWLGHPGGWSRVTAPGGLWLFGERGVNAVGWYDDYQKKYGYDIDDLKRLFPEAEAVEDMEERRRRREAEAAERKAAHVKEYEDWQRSKVNAGQQH